ncbi:MAG: ABC transporter ATP-binding protein [Chloroflexota bacterium]|nr:ABC transporter ATP-binding protein [Chloroflexota bacterium]MDE2909755.1 ABC transporter ATP-binding protein [Chloroflexota bacterium]
MKLSLRELSVSFRDPDGRAFSALGPISFEVAAQQFVCLVGPTGCGKSTLIRVLAGLLPATSGSARCDGELISRPMDQFAIMFQDANLMPWRTVLDNIALPLEIDGVPRASRYETVRALLPQLHLGNFEASYPAELSGGMAQRVALGRVIVQAPRVLLLDEPFGALDALTREKLSLDLLRLRQRNVQTIIMVTHDISEAVLLADRVLVMSRRPGTLVEDIAVELPRPRRSHMIYLPEFLRLAKRVRESIETLNSL